jgi:phenylpropionate dioxygenase-like ring-hydroxylating dioxygenase large terminal subunit
MILNQWYLACLPEELEKQNPLKKKIVGKEIVIFKNKKGEIGIIEDRCCHRNVRLSLGYIKDDCIKCAYHGWEYNTDGECVHIPSFPAGEQIPKTARVEKYSTQLKHKAIWVWLGDPQFKDSTPVPPMVELDEYPRVYNYHYLKADLQLVAESLIDAYHINHVHRNSIGSFMGNLHGENVNFKLAITDTALTGEYIRHNEGTIWEKLYFGFAKEITTRIGFWFPATSKLDINFRKKRMVIYEHFYQVDEETVCMLQITCWKKILTQFPLNFFAKSMMLKKSNTIVEEDLVFLENNKEVKDRTGKRDLLIKSDEVTFEFTKLWNRNLPNKSSNHSMNS